MTFAELKARATLLATIGGYTNSSVSPDWGAAVNVAYREYCWEAEVHRETDTITTVAGTAEYALDLPAWKLIEEVLYEETPLSPMDVYTLRQEYPNWLIVDDATPQYWVRSSPKKLRLWPAPDTSDDTVTIYGIRTPADLSADGDVPIIPEVDHEGIAERAAWFVLEPWARGEERQALQDRVDAYIRRIRKTKGVMAAEMFIGASQGRPDIDQEVVFQ